MFFKCNLKYNLNSVENLILQSVIQMREYEMKADDSYCAHKDHLSTCERLGYWSVKEGRWKVMEGRKV